MSGFDARHIMQAIHRVAGEQVEQAVIDHGFRAGFAFFRRLEDEMQHAVEALTFRQVAGGAQQHRCMSVMAAGMHFAVMHGTVVEGVFLLDKQGVHVGAEPDRAIGIALAQGPDHAGAAQATMHIEAPAFKPFSNDVGGAVLLVGRFWMFMNVAPDRLQFVGQRFDLPALFLFVLVAHGSNSL